MEKSHFFKISIPVLLLFLFSSSIKAQQRTLILNKGNYYSASEIPGGGFGRCYCGQAAYNCICGFVNFSDFETPNILVGQIGVVVSTQVVSRDTLLIKFREKLRMELKTNDFVQEESVLINSEVAKSLGYKSITILPGTYTIKADNTLAFSIKCGEPYQTRGWGLIGFIVAVIILVSIIAGQSSAPSGSTGSQNCDDCRRDMAWYNGLKWYKKIAFHAWYITRWSICKASGCI